MSNNGNKKYLMILLLVLAFSLAVGYAVFSDTLTITGTANAKGSFDVNFISADIVDSEGINVSESVVDITGTDDTLEVVIKDLAYPGAGAQIQAVIKNEGTVPAKVVSVTPTNIDGNGNAIKLTGLDAITTSHKTLAAGETCTIDFVVSWDSSVGTLDTSVDGENDTTDFNFGLIIDYEQDTTAFSGTASHSDN